MKHCIYEQYSMLTIEIKNEQVHQLPSCFT